MHRYRLGRLTLLSMEPAELFQVAEPGLRHVVTVNAEIFVLAHEHASYGALLARTWNTIDGRPLQWLTALLNRGPFPRKLSGSDLLEPLAGHCREYGRRLFLLGATAQANALACRRLRERWPGVAVDGYAPPVTDDIAAEGWNTHIFAAIERFRPEYLVLALGSPKGDFWLERSRPRLEALGVRWAAGFGAALNFTAGLVPRAPRAMQWAGLEWVFRLLVERGLWRRTLRKFRLPYYALRHRPRP